MNLENLPVKNAIAKLNSDTSDKSRINLYHELSKDGLLLLAVKEAPDTSHPNGAVLEDNTKITMLTSTGPDGLPVIVAFTDLPSLNARSPNSPYVGMATKTVLEMVLSDKFSGIIINPAGPWAGVPKEDVENILNGTWS